MNHSDTHARNGLLAGGLAFLIWGAFPIYFKVVGDISALEMLAHRIVWAVPFGALIISARRQWPDVRSAIGNPRVLGMLLLSAFLITINWIVYIWAVQHEQVFQASLGYYINPLILVLVGFLFLGERLRRMQTVAVILAAAGVAVLTFSGGVFPYLSITLAFSFAAYGIVRKKVAIGAMPGLFVETLVLLPFAATYLAVLILNGSAVFTLSNPGMAGILLFSGPLTVMPLLLFAVAARQLPLSTIGFLQFIAPTGQFLVGYYYGETLTAAHLVCFSLIWSAVLVFIIDVSQNSKSPGITVVQPE